MKNKIRSIVMICFLAIAGIFGVSSALINKQVNETPVVEKADATTVLSGNVYRFTKSTNDWEGGVYAYAYGGSAESMDWPGISLGYSYNNLDQLVYVYTTSGKPGTIIFHNNRTDNGKGRRSEVSAASASAWYVTGNSGNWKDGQLIMNTSTWTPSNYTYYFYDYHGSFAASGLKAYAYGSGHDIVNASWPGVAMSAVSGSSGHLYSVSVDPMFDKLIISSGEKQTDIDSDWTNKKSGQCLAAYEEGTLPTSWSTDMDDIYANDWIYIEFHDF